MRLYGNIASYNYRETERIPHELSFRKNRRFEEWDGNVGPTLQNSNNGVNT